MKELFNSMLLFALLSGYYVPSNVALHQGLFSWCLQMRGEMRSSEAFQRVLYRILNNFKLFEDDEDAAESDQDLQQMSEENAGAAHEQRGRTSAGKFEDNSTGILSWPPSMLEIDSLATGKAIAIRIHLAHGDSVTQQVDETSTVEGVLQQVLQTHAHLKKEHEIETFWLFRRQNLNDDEMRGENPTKAANQEFDHPLPREKKILKLMYQAERQHLYTDRAERLHDARQSSTKGRVSVALASLVPKVRGHSHSEPHDGASNDLQKCHLIIKKRIFSSLYVMKNFKKL